MPAKLKKSIISFVEGLVSRHFEPVLKESPLLGWGLIILFFPMTATGAFIWAQSFHERCCSSVNTDMITASLSDSQSLIPANNELIDFKGGPEYVTFTGSWRPNKKDAYLQNGLEIFLADRENQVRFDHSLPVPFGSVFRLIFTLGGENGGNLQFGRHGAYEITIGDGDFKTIAVRDGEGNLMKEFNSQELRFRLEREIIGDISSELYVTEKIKDEKTLHLEIYLSGNSSMAYDMPLTPKWKENDDIYFALLDLDGDNKTSVYWSEPEIARFINN
jgi:hypothetical protein